MSARDREKPPARQTDAPQPAKMEVPVDNLSDTELADLSRKVSQEVSKRTEERKRRAEAARVERNEKLAVQLSHPIIDLLTPKHIEGCSDESPINGWGADAMEPDCKRCALLQLMKEGAYVVEPPFVITVAIERDYSIG